MYKSFWFVLFVAFALCACLGPFEYCSSVKHTTEACCAVGHFSAKPTSGLACRTHQQSYDAMSTSVASTRVTFLSKIKRTAAVFWQN